MSASCPAVTVVSLPAVTVVMVASFPAVTAASVPAVSVSMSASPAVASTTASPAVAVRSVMVASFPAVTVASLPAVAVVMSASCPAVTVVSLPAVTVVMSASFPAVTAASVPAVSVSMSASPAVASTTASPAVASRRSMSALLPAVTVASLPAVSDSMSASCAAVTLASAPAVNCSMSALPVSDVTVALPPTLVWLRLTSPDGEVTVRSPPTSSTSAFRSPVVLLRSRSSSACTLSTPSALSPTMTRSAGVLRNASPCDEVVSVPPICTATGCCSLPMAPAPARSVASPPVTTFNPSGAGLASQMSPAAAVRRTWPPSVLSTRPMPNRPSASVTSMSPGAVAVRHAATSASRTRMVVKSTWKRSSSLPVSGLRKIVHVPSCGIASGTLSASVTFATAYSVHARWSMVTPSIVPSAAVAVSVTSPAVILVCPATPAMYGAAMPTLPYTEWMFSARNVPLSCSMRMSPSLWKFPLPSDVPMWTLNGRCACVLATGSG